MRGCSSLASDEQGQFSGDVRRAAVPSRPDAKLDRAATAKVIHANAAARTKSRLSAAIKALKTK